jgi:transcriptional regulator with XRE-family HTH domain
MEATPRHYIAAEVRAELARQGRSKKDLEDLLGVSRQAVWSRLAGVVPFTTEELVKVAQWLNVAVAKFLPDTVEAAS